MFSFLFFTAYLIAQNFLAVQSSAVALTELHFCWSLLWAVASTVVRVADRVCVVSIHHFAVQSQTVSEKVQHLRFHKRATFAKAEATYSWAVTCC